MKKNYTLDIVSKTLTITKDFDDKMADPESTEYKLYLQLTTDIPNLKVIGKTHKTPTKYKTKSGVIYKHNQYKYLTYERMEAFIAVMDNEELTANFKTVRDFAKTFGQKGYKIVREWFEEQFPKYRTEPKFYLDEAVKIIDLDAFKKKAEENTKIMKEAI